MRRMMGGSCWKVRLMGVIFAIFNEEKYCLIVLCNVCTPGIAQWKPRSRVDWIFKKQSFRKKSGQGSSLTHARGHSRSSLTVPRGLVSSCLTIARDLLCSSLTVAKDLLQCSLTFSRSFLRESKILFKEVHFRSISKSREYVFYEINPP